MWLQRGYDFIAKFCISFDATSKQKTGSNQTKGVKPFDFKSFDLGTFGSDITIRKSPIHIHVAPQVDKNPRNNKHQKMIPVTGLFVTLTRSASKNTKPDEHHVCGRLQLIRSN